MDTISAILTLVLVADLACGLIVFSRNRKSRVNKIFLYFTLAVALWVVSKIAFRSLQNHDQVLIVCMILYFGAGLLLLVINYFVRVFQNPEYKYSKLELILLPIPTLFVSIISLLPGFLINDINIRQGLEVEIIYNQFLHTIYGLYIVGYFVMAHIIMLKMFLKSDKKLHIAAVIYGIIVASVMGMVGNLLLPYINIFTLNWIGEIGVLGMVIPVTYSLLRHKLFDVKVIVVEILVYALWSVLLFRLVISANISEIILNSITLALSIIIGIAVIQSVRKEILTREGAEVMAKDLELANVELKQLDKLKSEFVSLATHHVATPLTAVSGYVSILREGDFKDRKDEERTILNNLSRLTGNMVSVIKDFLDVSRIERGNLKYYFDEADLITILGDLVNEYEYKIKHAGLKFSFRPSSDVEDRILADETKLKQALGNILDNSLTYTKSGHIEITCKRDRNAGNYIVTISDTGVRVLPTMSQELFHKFTSSGNKDEANVIGNSLGLYVTKQIVEAHKGELRITSDENSKNKEWHFTVTIPVKVL